MHNLIKFNNFRGWLNALLLLCSFAVASANDASAAATAAKVHGTATLADGSPLNKGLVTLTDANGQQASASSTASGKFAINTTGLTAPFLLLTTPADASAPLYGYAVANGIANVDVYTDLIVNMIYSALSSTPSAGAIPPAQSAASMTDDLRLVSATTQNLILSWLVKDKVKLKNFNLTTNKFAANSRKFGALLHQTVITKPFAIGSDTLGSETIQISGSLPTQTIVFTAAPPADGNLTATVTGSSSSTASSITLNTAILVSAEQAAEFDAINAVLTSFQGIVDDKKKSLAATDIQPLFSPGYVRGGEDLTQATADEVTTLRGVKLGNITVTQLNSIEPDPADSSKNDLSVVYQYDENKNRAPGVTDVFQCPNPIGSGSCVFFGNQQIAQTAGAVSATWLTTSDPSNQATGPTIGPALGVDVLAPTGALSAVTIDDTEHKFFDNTAVPFADVLAQNFFPAPGGTPLPYNEDEYRFLLPSLPTIPPAKMDFSISVTPTGGAPLSYVTALTGSAGEAINLINPSLAVGVDHSLTAAPIGKTASVKWGLPSYPVQSISLSGQVIATCDVAEPVAPVKVVTAKSTSGSIAFPSIVTQNSATFPIQEVDIDLGIVGVNGASSRLVYQYGQCSS